MTILLVEDDIHKNRQIADFLSITYTNATVVTAHSFQSGARALREARPSVAILDMTLPTFDVVEGGDGGRTRSFGGRDLLYEIQDDDIRTYVIIITQFETFGEAGDRRTLSQVTAELARDFPAHFRGTVYYHPARSDWRSKLLDLLTPILRAA